MMISKEQLDKLPLFEGISSEAAAGVAPHLRERSFLPGEYIFFRGEPGHSMFIVVEGKVAVTLTNDEGHDYTIATLQEGSFFGELGLLAGEPRSARVKAVTAVLAAEIEQEEYAALNRAFPGFHSRLKQVLIRRVAKAKVQWQGERVKSVKGVTRCLLSVRESLNEECLPGVSPWAKDFNRLVEEIALTDAHVMISGEAGTERVFIARLLISKSGANHLPFLSLNCSTPPKVRRETSPEALEEAQESALFGHEAGSAEYATGWRRGYLDIADTGTIVLDHVEDLSPKVQARLLRYLETSSFSRIGSDQVRRSKIRIISTTTRDLDAMVRQGKFNGELLELLRGCTLRIIPLRERVEDIPAMAMEFLIRYKRRNQEQIGRFSRRAMKALVSHKWPLNFAELNTVISQAVSASQGKNVIEEEHLFFDVRSSLKPAGGINLLRKKGISQILRHRLVPGALRYLTVPFFVCLILYTLFGPREHNLGNIVAWSLLWPFLLLSIIVSGRGFCAYCPISAVSNAFAYGRKKFLSFPGVMKNYGIWIGITAFVSIFWIEHVTEAFLNPRVTGTVFLCISGSAIITALLFGKRIWCLHICPLGRMLGELAVLSIMELRANSRVCVWQCESRACLKEKNCPMGLHPGTERTRHDCILCLACAKKCKQKSVHLDLLPPHKRILAMKSWDFSRTAFVVLLTGSVLASQALRWSGSLGAFAAFDTPEVRFDGEWKYFLTGIAMTTTFAGLTFLASRVKGWAEWTRDFVHAGFAYMPLAFFGLFDIYFGQFLTRGDEIPRLSAKLLGLGNSVSGAHTAPTIAFLQIFPPILALTGGVLSFYLLRKLHAEYHLHPRSYHLHQALIILTCVAFLLIF